MTLWTSWRAPDAIRDGQRIYAPSAEGAGHAELLVASFLGLGVCMVVGFTFTITPALDINAARLLHAEGRLFAFTGSPFWTFIRETAFKFLTLNYIVIAVCLAAAVRKREAVFGLPARDWFYLASVSLIGPALVVNLLLKQHWGRWRPRQVAEFGGAEAFTAVLQPFAGGCLGNCSFVSGEVAAATMAFISLAFVARGNRTPLYVAAIAATALMTLIRMGQGGTSCRTASSRGALW